MKFSEHFWPEPRPNGRIQALEAQAMTAIIVLAGLIYVALRDG